MPKIIFIDPDGTETEVQAQAGQSVMTAARVADLDGIVGDCGGNCSCATCHGYIGEAWAKLILPPSQMERDMLEGALFVEADSRLTCQVVVTDELDGLVVRLPEAQS